MERKEKDDFDVDIQACSIMDCTGLIPSLPQDEAEKEAYEDLYPYVTKGKLHLSSAICRPPSPMHKSA